MKKQKNLTAPEIKLQITKASLEMAMRKQKNTNIVKNLRRDWAQALTHE